MIAAQRQQFTEAAIRRQRAKRPRDAKKFLSYASASSARVNLPEGATGFALLVLYGETIMPVMFAAPRARPMTFAPPPALF